MNTSDPPGFYDGVDYLYRHENVASHTQGRRLIASLLRLDSPPAGELLFDFWLYSGGAGVINRFAFAVPDANGRLWATSEARPDLLVPEAVSADDPHYAGYAWLLADDEDYRGPLRPPAATFINGQRRDFHPPCGPNDRVLIERESNGNTYALLWHAAGRLNWLGYDQG